MRGLALEFLVIVVGVLLALGVDRWSQGLDERRMEQDYLRRVEADLLADSAMLVDRLERAANGLTRIGELWAAIDTMSESYVPSREAVISAAGFYGSPPEAVTNTFDELTSTGGLSLLRAEAVRVALLDYYRQSEASTATLGNAMQRGREPWLDAAHDAGAMLLPEQRGRAMGVWVSPDLPRLLRRAQQNHVVAQAAIPPWQERVGVTLRVVRAARASDLER